MFAAVRHVAMKSFMLVWLHTSPRSWRGLPVPEAGPPVVADGPNLQRILLCGSGIVVGYGVSSHELALGGALARAIAPRTNRGAEVTTMASPRLSTKTAKSQLSTQVLTGMDAVVLSLGTFDLLTFLPAHTWAHGLHKLVRSLLTQTGSRAHIFIVDCTAPKMSYFPEAYQRHLQRMTSVYNEEIRLLADQYERVHQINFSPEPEDPEAVEGRHSYRSWAEAIAPTIASELIRQPSLE